MVAVGSNGFYLHMLSNASLDIFPENRPWSFKVKLAENLNLDTSKEYVVGVSEIMVGQIYQDEEVIDTNKEKDNSHLFINAHFNFQVTTPAMGTQNFVMKPTDPDDKKKIVNQMKSLLKTKNQHKDVHVSCHARTLRTTITILTPGTTVRISDDLMRALEFKKTIFSRGQHASFFPELVQKPLKVVNCFLYSNVCERSLVGDLSLNLLRLIPIYRNNETQHLVRFPKAFYNKVNFNSDLSILEFDLRDENGTFLPLDGHTPTVIVLHIKEVL